jgi:hypothetical protein
VKIITSTGTLLLLLNETLRFLGRNLSAILLRSKEEAQRFASYKDFVSRNKKKRESGFLHFKVTPFSILLRRERLVILIRV